MTAEHKALAEKLGIDISKIDWAKWIQFLQLILSFFQGHQNNKTAMKATLKAAGCPDEDCDHVCLCCEAACHALQSAELSLQCCGDCCAS